MDKQQLARKIWDAADAMRGKIDANKYKDAFLGLMFYKFLSDKEKDYFLREGMPADELEKHLVPGSYAEDMARKNLGYFIAYDHLYSTWVKVKGQKKKELSINVTEALAAFDKNYNRQYAHVFEGIFKSFRTVIGDLGGTADERSALLGKLIRLMSDIPTMGRYGYDTLGFIYEYLIGKFAANAGQKAGEFYTPYEVARVMAEIVGDHCSDRETLQVYDPTSGSASLLLNIGDVIETNNGRKGSIKYFAQELKTDAHNLTRMNLFMRGVAPANMVTREADSLDEDWPEEDQRGIRTPLLVDAVVSNPPYSAHWDREGNKGDPRFAYGLAPKKKADYAFVLHELYHLKDDGIMTVVLPHGVLFRKNQELPIRKALVDNFHIETIIGFPAGVFYGTGISTLVMVLKKKREDTDILFVDASQGFAKVGTDVFLRDRDVRKIVDVVTERKNVENFSRLVSYDEIIDNGYNLNIPRYVSAAKGTETHDIYATMYGGIPQYEIDDVTGLDDLEGLRGEIFTSLTETHTDLKDGLVTKDDVTAVVHEHPSVQTFVDTFTRSMHGFDDAVFNQIFDNAETLQEADAEKQIREDIFARVNSIDAADPYALYEFFAQAWNQIGNDLDIIKTDGWGAAREIETLTELDKDSNDGEEKVIGYEGRLIPLELARQELFADEIARLEEALGAKAEAQNLLTELAGQIDDENKQKYLTAKGALDSKAVNAAVKEIYAAVETPEITTLLEFCDTPAKGRPEFLSDNPQIDWAIFDTTAKGIPTAASVKKHIKKLQENHQFEEGTIERVLVDTSKALAARSAATTTSNTLKKQIDSSLHDTVKQLTDEQVRELMRIKWVGAMADQIAQYPLDLLDEMVAEIMALQDKYAVTLGEVGEKIAASGKSVASLLDQMTGSEKDMAGIAALSALIGGGK